MVGTRRLERLSGQLAERLRLPDGDLVVALSGGADSAALAWLCRAGDRVVRALHVNHGFPNSPTMESAARAIGERLDVEIEIANVDVPSGASPEGQARRVRYTAFSEATCSGEALLTAHTKDDQVETVLFNLIRGTGAKGLGGIPYFRQPNIFRPTLEVARSEARELATLADLPFVDDPMNHDMSLSRNVIRSRILPVLTEMNPRLDESIVRMAGSLATDNRYLGELAGGVEIVVDESGVSVAVGALFAVPQPIRDRVLKELLSRALGTSGVSAERVQSLWEVASGSVDRVEVGQGAAARRRGSHLLVSTPTEEAGRTAVRLLPGMTRQGDLVFELAAFDRACMVAPLSKWQAVFPAGTALDVDPDGTVKANGVPAWIPGVQRLPVAFYEPGTVGYLSVRAFEEAV